MRTSQRTKLISVIVDSLIDELEKAHVKVCKSRNA